MRIVHYVASTDSRCGGVPRFALDAARLMSERGHRVTILTGDTTDAPPAWVEQSGVDGLRTAPVVAKIEHNKLGMISRGAMRRVRDEVSGADCVHLHCVWSLAGAQIARLCRSLGVAYVVSAHGMLDAWSMRQSAFKKKLFMAGLAGPMLRGAARVHCTAEAELDQSCAYFPRAIGAIVPCVVDLAQYRDLPGRGLARERFAFLRDGEPLVLFLSRLHYKKGCDVLLRAFASVRGRTGAGRLVFGGTGDEAYVNSLRALADELGISQHVHFVGQVQGAEKVSLYQNADLFALPTSQENFGIVLTEALAAGTPVVTTKGTDIWRDLEASGAATIVEQTPAAFAAELERLLGDASTRVAMGAKARPWIFETFDEDALAGRFSRMYGDAAATAKVPTTVPTTARATAPATARTASPTLAKL